MTARAVELEIGELVLDGFAPADRHRIAAAFQNELSRLIVAGDASGLAPRRVDRIDAGAFAVRGAGNPAAVGHQIARSIHDQLYR